MKNEDLLKESIQIILNYDNRSIVVELKKYKTLEDIKEKVYELFYPVKNKISLYLNNKNLEPLIDQPIGYIFSGKSLVNLKVLNEGVIDSPYKLVKRFQDTNIINDVTNVYSRLNFQKSANKTNMASLLNDRYDLDIDKMKKEAKSLIGTYDFKGFMSSGSSVTDTVRTIYNIEVSKSEDLIIIEIEGNGFLYNMVRIISGTLLEVGCGKIDAKDVKEILDAKDRKRAGKSLPANGLFLVNVDYEGDAND
jgi:tRNA pseudouridine(38-40) synthase